jgi:predicted outer membrane repeat protein
VRGCVFENNTASSFGGGLYLLERSGAVTVADSSFRRNTATLGDGGAIEAGGNTGALAISGCAFEGNTADGVRCPSPLVLLPCFDCRRLFAHPLRCSVVCPITPGETR